MRDPGNYPHLYSDRRGFSDRSEATGVRPSTLAVPRSSCTLQGLPPPPLALHSRPTLLQKLLPPLHLPLLRLFSRHLYSLPTDSPSFFTLVALAIVLIILLKLLDMLRRNFIY